MARRITIEDPNHDEKRISVTGTRLDVQAIIESGVITEVEVISDIAGGLIDEVTLVGTVSLVDLITLVAESRAYMKTGDATFQSPRLDVITHAMIGIEFPHHEIHEADSFVASDVQQVDTTTFKWQIVTPASVKYSHIIFDIEGTGEISLVLTEGSDRTNGVALALINRCRIGTPPVPTLLANRTPTAGNTDGAVTLYQKRSGSTSASGKAVFSGGARSDNEFILKPATKYVVAVETFATIYVSMAIDWYEHTNKTA